MKKLITLILASAFVLGLVGCGNEKQPAPQEDPDTYTLDVMESYVREIGREAPGLPVEISEKDASTLSKIIDGGTPKENAADHESDCVINLKGHLMHYNSDSGALSKYSLSDMPVLSSQEPSVGGESFMLSDADRAAVNAILDKYISLETDVG